MTSSSTALVPWKPQGGREHHLHAKGAAKPENKGCGSPARWSTRNKWLIASSVVLALGAGVLGSVWFGLAAVLPLLYLLPCLAMLAMCMKGMKGNKPQDSGNT